MGCNGGTRREASSLFLCDSIAVLCLKQLCIKHVTKKTIGIANFAAKRSPISKIPAIKIGTKEGNVRNSFCVCVSWCGVFAVNIQKIQNLLQIDFDHSTVPVPSKKPMDFGRVPSSKEKTTQINQNLMKIKIN